MLGKILIGVGILALIAAAVAYLSVKTNENEPPPKLVANFVDLNKIEKISKYRSCTGHVTVPQDGRESRRNMKHYFWVKPEFNKGNTVEIYSPYDGYVSVVRDEPGLNLEGEIWIRPKSNFVFLPPVGVWQFSVQHIDVNDDLKRGSEVKAGQLLGFAALSEKRGNSFDIVFGKMSIFPKKIDNWTAPFTDLDSIFNQMSENVLGQYKQKGLTEEEIILSKEIRDQNPCTYKGNGPYFDDKDDTDNWVVLK